MFPHPDTPIFLHAWSKLYVCCIAHQILMTMRHATRDCGCEHGSVDDELCAYPCAKSLHLLSLVCRLNLEESMEKRVSINTCIMLWNGMMLPPKSNDSNGSRGFQINVAWDISFVITRRHLHCGGRRMSIELPHWLFPIGDCPEILAIPLGY